MADQSPDPTHEAAEWAKMLRQAWFTSKLECDKAIITLSSAGLALVVAFIAKIPSHDCISKIILLFGLIAFLVSILAGIRCLKINGEIIVTELKGESEKTHPFADHILFYGFGVGVSAIFLIGLISIIKL